MQNNDGTKTETLKELLDDKAIILASNRSPVELNRNDAGELEEKRGGGGLVSAMTAVSETSHATWIAAAVTKDEQELARKEILFGIPNKNSLYQIRFVDIPPKVYDLYYNTISNPLLWFVFHYLWDLTVYPNIGPDIYQAWSEGYVSANKIFAEAVIEESTKHSKPIIMLQDYHLFLAAKYIRESTSNTILLHFTHIPWPEPKYMSVLPNRIRTDILKGLLSNDIVGFQSRNYEGNFLLCCESLLDCQVDWSERTVKWNDRIVRVNTYPISVDDESLKTVCASKDVVEIENSILEASNGMKLIVRTDRSDPSKNIIRGFLAFDMMLSRHKELKEKVKFMALLYPTRENIKEYKEYQRKIITTVHSINEKHQTDVWTPIHLRIKDNYLESMAALNSYDVLLVNPVFDGMNLVAKEGPIVNHRNGVLVLSENAGAVSELSDGAIIINPFDVNETANALYRAVTMTDKERRSKASNLRNAVRQNNSVKWLSRQLKDINLLEKSNLIK